MYKLVALKEGQTIVCLIVQILGFPSSHKNEYVVLGIRDLKPNRSLKNWFCLVLFTCVLFFNGTQKTCTGFKSASEGHTTEVGSINQFEAVAHAY